ncbi:hypothetical protein FGG08_003968 [Glutinoglossum americanum]|uniref:Zn(2)-C6 fungal-type domain-containing protein n=1 Tax=Glutinoglossum americanum TaxID=1670608 RepID=A0A9P8I393_9PEZI|nr:hypothetical protein FGG08_003968 [Glutinoglossum americanum]
MTATANLSVIQEERDGQTNFDPQPGYMGEQGTPELGEDFREFEFIFGSHWWVKGKDAPAKSEDVELSRQDLPIGSPDLTVSLNENPEAKAPQEVLDTGAIQQDQPSLALHLDWDPDDPSDRPTSAHSEMPMRPKRKSDKKLSDWKTHELNTACQHCRDDQVLCDKSKPSCLNCQQQDRLCYFNPLCKVPSDPFSKLKTWWRPYKHSRDAGLNDGQRSPTPGERRDNATSSQEGNRKPETSTGIAPSWFLHPASRPRSGEKMRNANDEGLPATPPPAPRALETNPDGLSASPASHVSLVFSAHTSAAPISSSHSSATLSSHTHCHHSSGESHQPPSSVKSGVPAAIGGPPEPFQCTYCLRQCLYKWEWKQHEQSLHFPQLLLGELQEAYWNCGFCSHLPRTWDERIEHIGEHYEEGLTMASWDPRSTPAPLHQDYLTPIRGFKPEWDAAALLTIQRLSDSANRPYRPEITLSCRHCSIYFSNTKELDSHLETYHTPSELWSCPNLNDMKLLAQRPPFAFFAPVNETPVDDFCLCCGDEFTSPPDWSARFHHLRDEHHFESCEHGEKFSKKSHFMRHLANRHNFILGSCSDRFMSACKKTEPALALATMAPAARHSR